MADEESNVPTIEALQSQLAEMTTSMTSMKVKNEELLGETKAAKAARRKAEEDAQAEVERIATESGNHEQLYQSLQGKYSSLEGEFEGLKGTVATEKRNNAAMKIATELADGSNADLLSEFISRRLKFTDDGVKVTDSSGALTVSSLTDLATEFKNDTRYAALLKGNQSSGGGASGGGNGGGAAKTMARTEFNALSQKDPIAASKFMKDGGQLTDNQWLQIP